MTDRARWNLVLVPCTWDEYFGDSLSRRFSIDNEGCGSGTPEGDGYVDYFMAETFGEMILGPPEVTIDCRTREPK